MIEKTGSAAAAGLDSSVAMKQSAAKMAERPFAQFLNLDSGELNAATGAVQDKMLDRFGMDAATYTRLPGAYHDYFRHWGEEGVQHAAQKRVVEPVQAEGKQGLPSTLLAQLSEG